jgi:hypothetical protein
MTRNVNPDNMFTTDPELIRTYIASSKKYKTMIDPAVIERINHKAQSMNSEQDFMEYISVIPGEEYDMLLYFQNIVDNNERITKILRKKRATEEEAIYLMNWSSSNYAVYVWFHQSEEEPYVFNESDFIR